MRWPLFFFFPHAHRYQQSSKSSSHPSTLQPGAKSESLREEMEEAANRMEICRVSHQSEPLEYYSLLQLLCSPFDLYPSCVYETQMDHNTRMILQLYAGEIISYGMLVLYFLFQDQLSADMYSFVAKEIDYANYFQTVSRFYHQSSNPSGKIQ